MAEKRPPYDGRIVSDPQILVGKPTIKGMRISVELILEYLANRPDFDEFFADYPDLTMADVRAALAYACDLAAGKAVTPAPRRHARRRMAQRV